MPIDPITLAVGAQALGGLFSAIGGSRQPDPEAIYRKRIEEALKYTGNLFRGYEIGAESQAARDMRQVQQLGARQAAALGYTGGSGAFTSPGESSISARLAAARESIRGARTDALLGIKRMGLDAPIINKPNAFQYLGTFLGGAGDILATQGALKPADTTSTNNFNNFAKSLAGQTSLDGALNRHNSGINWTQNYFTYGNPLGNQYKSPLAF